MSAMPVQRLSGNAREAYLAHLLSLEGEDVRLRFGAPLSREAIARYVARIDFDTDSLFGIHGDTLELCGAAHLAFGTDLAELGISVLPYARRRGIGGALIARAAEYARNRATARLYMHCLGENATMIRLARRAGMGVVLEEGDADAHVALPAATPMSHTSELIAERVALFDYALKSNVETWRRVGVAIARASDA